jgi:hypothetical protein
MGHPGWRYGIGERWMHHRAECIFRGRFACLKERIYSPDGVVCYRVTPAGVQEGVVLEVEEQAANDQYDLSVGEPAPSTDDGPLPGSEQSADGSQVEDPGDDGAQDASVDTADPVADAGSGDAETEAAAGYFAGWQMPFTDSFGGINPFSPAAYDSEYAYPGFGPGFYGYNGWGWGY